MRRGTMKSELIRSIGYDSKTQTMEVEYRDDGRIFVYFGVPFSTFRALVRAGNNSPTAALYNLPTKNVIAGGSVSLTGAQCVNFQTGAVAVVSQSATIQRNTSYLFVNTTNRGIVALLLDNGGTITGLSVYNLNPGAAVLFSFDGTNLN